MSRDNSWPAVFILGIICLLRPFLSLVGPFESIGLTGSILVSVAIAINWRSIVVGMGVKCPDLTLATANALYGILSVLLAVFVPVFF